MTPHSVQIKINDTSLSIETGKVAKQADGSVVVRCGGTVVLSTAVASRTALEGRDFLPLTVEYRERAYAAAASRAASSSGKAGPTRRRR